MPDTPAAQSAPNPADRFFSLPVRVYYEDTDAGGIVYYANYLKFMERARTEFLRSMGFEQDVVVQEYQRMFVVTAANVRYRQAACFNQMLHVTARVIESRRASLSFAHEVFIGDAVPDGNVEVASQSHQVACTATVALACLDSETHQPAGFPAPMAEMLAGQISPRA